MRKSVFVGWDKQEKHRKARYLALSHPLGYLPNNLERIAGANSRRDGHLLLVLQEKAKKS